MVMGGSDLFNLWGTAEAVTVGAGDNASSTLSPFFPDPGATRLCVVRHAPRSHGAASGATPEQVRAEAEERHPGLADGLASDSSGMHTTDSVDYAICVDGELWLELDDGAAVHVTPGTFVVQRGTRHAWRNRSDDHCTMIYVIIGASRIS